MISLHSWFKGVTQQPCKCGSERCRGTLGKRSDAPFRKSESTPVVKSKKRGNGKGKWAKKIVTKITTTTAAISKSVLARTTSNSIKTAPKLKAANLQKSVLAQPKAKRKPPTQRRPATPSPAPSPVPSVSDSEDEGITSPDRQLLEIPPAPTPPPAIARNRPRITRTYKVNKTIAQAAASKPVTSTEALEAARESALADVLTVTNANAAGTASACTAASVAAATKRTARRLTIPGVPVLV